MKKETSVFLGITLQAIYRVPTTPWITSLLIYEYRFFHSLTSTTTPSHSALWFLSTNNYYTSFIKCFPVCLIHHDNVRSCIMFLLLFSGCSLIVCRNTIYFYDSILCPIIVHNLLVRSNSLLNGFLRVCYQLDHATISKDYFFFFLSSWVLCF